jgi:hypothetical protein
MENVDASLVVMSENHMRAEKGKASEAKWKSGLVPRANSRQGANLVTTAVVALYSLVFLRLGILST